jgi:signal transduction histidine kinase
VRVTAAPGLASRSWPRVGIRGVVLTISAFALVVPLASIVLLRIFDDQLIQRTEAQLIGQAVLIAEAWREAWRVETASDIGADREWVPPQRQGDLYFPIEPMLQLGQGVLPPTDEPERFALVREGPAWRAGRAVEPILRRAVRMNLSSVRVLDTNGCVVASSAGQHGACIDDLAEVGRALRGDYAAVLRHRVAGGQTPRYDSISRRGRVRAYIALPVFSGGEVIGVVRLVRTVIDPGKALWFDRFRLLSVLLGCALLTAALSLFLSRTLTQPLRDITRRALGIARGEGRRPMTLSGLAPKEFDDMSRALDQMIGQLSDRAEYISEFAANLSHELKTPITGIRGASELLSQQWESMTDEERGRFLVNIEAGAARMERLVNRLLELARIQSAPETAEDVDLASFLESLVRGYGARLVLEIEDSPSSIRINPDHLESALRNLIENALRHGAGQPVDLDVETRGERVVFRVRDRGPGISNGNRDRIFQRFFTTERDAGGTGLGLAIARAVAETRGGRLDFTSDTGGTCFELVL